MSVNDHLALTVLAFICLLAAAGFLLVGTHWMRVNAFPFAFLLFIVPLPDATVRSLERALVVGSTDTASLLFTVAGTPFIRQGTLFELPGVVLHVAQECSGIRSTWVLLITAVLAGHLFLRGPWRRLALVAFVIPLGIIRNGCRILTIGLLCVHVGPNMIDSPIHSRGGPVFFAASLIPLLVWLWWLRRGEGRMTLLDRTEAVPKS